MTRRAAALAVAAFLCTGLVPFPDPAAGTTSARLLFHLTDRRIDEASGIGVGRSSPTVLYVQNDSGDSSRFFALNRATGATVATIEVPHARNVDWEDLAVGPDPAGAPSVWLADIGDNGASRSEVQVYRVDEPHLRASDRERRVTTARPDVWRLRYPDGPVNAESFAVTPAGVGYVITKSLLGASVVYRLPARPDPTRVQTLERVAGITFHLTGTPGGPNPFGQLTATGAAFSADGSLFVVRTYTDAYVWRVAHDDLTAALRTAPVRVALPAQPQGEGVTVDGGALLTDSEHVGSAVWSVPLAAPPSTTAPPAAPSAGPPPRSGPSPVSSAPAHRDGWTTAVSIGAVGVAGAGIAGLLARRRRRAAAVDRPPTS